MAGHTFTISSIPMPANYKPYSSSKSSGAKKDDASNNTSANPVGTNNAASSSTSSTTSAPSASNHSSSSTSSNSKSSNSISSASSGPSDSSNGNTNGSTASTSNPQDLTNASSSTASDPSSAQPTVDPNQSTSLGSFYSDRYTDDEMADAEFEYMDALLKWEDIQQARGEDGMFWMWDDEYLQGEDLICDTRWPSPSSMSMQEPSQGIERQLLPHVHLLSTYRYPQLHQIHADKVAEWLLGAPKIARDTAPFYWTYLDRPADGSILLVWQSPQLGSEFASDGYIWGPQEIAFQMDVGGYILDMYHAKIGFGPGEQVATHTRRRYRLNPSRNPGHQGPNPDPSLWLVHYTQADPAERVPSNVIPIDGRMNSTIQVRQHLHSQGQIIQKDFMLHDRTNWPQIAFPRRPQAQPMYAGNPPPRIPQQMAYPPQHQQGPPAKRQRPNAAAGPSTSNPAAVLDIDDEEDTSRGDLFDHITPREISVTRYKQNHEWMEEILSSPYAMNQLIPADLGLGLRGQLSSLTAEIFDAPFDPEKDVPKTNYVGRLDPEKAEEFRKRTAERIASENKEIERLKAKHARRLAKFQKGAILDQAEKELRTAVSDPANTGTEFWRLEGRIDEDDKEDELAVKPPQPKVSDIVAKVEASLGRHTKAVQELVRIQAGGYEEVVKPATPPAPAPVDRVSPLESGSNHSGQVIGDGDLDMNNSAAGLLDQFHTGLSSNATPGSSFPTPQAHSQSAAGTPIVASPQKHEADVTMTDAAAQPQGQGTDVSDWVVVPPGGRTPTPPQTALPTSEPPVKAPTPTEPAAANSPAVPTQPNTLSQANTPSALLAPSPAAPPTNTSTPLPDFHAASPSDFADLADLDSAGDALASYGQEMDVGDLDGGEFGGLDDSAFGDAFHAGAAGGGDSHEREGDSGL